MEQVFKTKRARRWWIIIVSLVVLIIFLNVYLEQSWAFSALGGIIISALMFYSQSKTIYIVKDNGVLEIKPGWGNRICVDGIRKVSYNPNAIILDLWSTNLKLVKTETPTLAQALYPLTGAIHVK